MHLFHYNAYLCLNQHRILCVFVGSNESTSGLGVGFGGTSEPNNAPQQGGAERLTAGGRVRVWHVLGGCQSGSEDGKTGGEQAKGAVRADAGHLRVRHQHDRGQRSETVRVSDLQKAAADRSQVRGLNRFRDGQ